MKTKLFFPLLLLCLLSCTTTQPPTPPPYTPVDSITIEKLEKQNIAAFSISPKGTYLAVIDSGSFKIISRDDLTDVALVPQEIKMASHESLRWSKNEKYAVFCNSQGYANDSDIFIISLDNGTVQNITDDNTKSKNLFEIIKNSVPIDTKPFWIDDKNRLGFTRKQYNQEKKYFEHSIWTISPDGTDPRLEYSIPFVKMTDFLPGTDWANDTFFYGITMESDTLPANGIWYTNNNRTNQIVSDAADTFLVYIKEANVIGSHLLIDYYNLEDRTKPFEGQVYSIWDLETGDERNIRPINDSIQAIFNCAFSPDGTKIVFAYQNKNNVSRLMIQDIYQKTEKSIFKSSEFKFGVTGLCWTSNNEIFVTTLPGESAIITLDNGENTFE